MSLMKSTFFLSEASGSCAAEWGRTDLNSEALTVWRSEECDAKAREKRQPIAAAASNLILFISAHPSTATAVSLSAANRCRISDPDTRTAVEIEIRMIWD